MATYTGDLIKIYWQNAADNDFIKPAKQTSITINRTLDQIDTSSKDSAWSSFVAGKGASTVSATFLYDPTDAAYAQALAFYNSRELITVRLEENSTEVYEAEGLITSLNISGPDADNAEVSIDFQISGAWSAV